MSTVAEISGALRATAVVLFLLVAALLGYFVLRGLRAAESDAPRAPRSPRPLLATVAASLLLLGLLFCWGFRAWMDLRVPPDHAYEIQVEAARSGWTYQYPEGTCGAANELVIPLSTPVRLTLSSRDVVHSLFLPAFRLQREVLPQRTSSLWLEARRMGTHDLLCAEHCAAGRTDGSSALRVVSVHEFKKWIAGGCGATNLPPRELGARLFRLRGCSTCHSITADRKDLAGPPLARIAGKKENTDRGAVTVDDGYMRESILDPGAKVVSGYQAVMPPFKGLLDDKQVNALLGYIKSLE